MTPLRETLLKLCRREDLTRTVGELGRVAAQHERELAAQQVGETREEAAQIDARIREPRNRREDLGRAPGGDVIEDLQVLVLRDQSERIAHSIGGESTVAEGENLVGETERVAHGAVGGAREERQRVALPLRHLC